MISARRAAEIIAARDSDREELARLRAEVARLQEVNDLLWRNYTKLREVLWTAKKLDDALGTKNDQLGTLRLNMSKAIRAALEGGAG